MIFQTAGAIDKILRGEKTETRRIWKPDMKINLWGQETVDSPLINEVLAMGENKPTRTLYQVGKTYAVQFGRGKPAVWRSPDMEPVHPDFVLMERLDWRGNPDDWKAGAGRECLLSHGYQPLRIRILELWREDVRTISTTSAMSEGYEDEEAFWEVWMGMHDKANDFGSLYRREDYALIREFDRSLLWEFPDERYDAVAIRFEVVR